MTTKYLATIVEERTHSFEFTADQIVGAESPEDAARRLLAEAREVENSIDARLVNVSEVECVAKVIDERVIL